MELNIYIKIPFKYKHPCLYDVISQKVTLALILQNWLLSCMTQLIEFSSLLNRLEVWELHSLYIYIYIFV